MLERLLPLLDRKFAHRTAEQCFKVVSGGPAIMNGFALRKLDVELFIVHPSLSPAEISSALGPAQYAHAAAVNAQLRKGRTCQVFTRRHAGGTAVGIRYAATEQYFVEEVERLLNDLESHKAFLRAIEARFAQMKHCVGLNRLRLRGMAGVREQVLLAAAALNLRSLVKLCPGLPA